MACVSQVVVWLLVCTDNGDIHENSEVTWLSSPRLSIWYIVITFKWQSYASDCLKIEIVELCDSNEMVKHERNKLGVDYVQINSMPT